MLTVPQAQQVKMLLFIFCCIRHCNMNTFLKMFKDYLIMDLEHQCQVPTVCLSVAQWNEHRIGMWHAVYIFASRCCCFWSQKHRFATFPVDDFFPKIFSKFCLFLYIIAFLPMDCISFVVLPLTIN